MSLAIAIVLVAHLIYAGVFIADRFVVSKAIPNPYAYTFYITLFSLSGFVILSPFGLHTISAAQMTLAIISGACFALATLFFFISLKHQPTTRVAPLVGGLTPLFTFIFSYALFEEKLPPYIASAITLLMLGSLIIAATARDERNRRISGTVLFQMLISAVFFGASFATSRLLYEETGFISGFLWSRLGGVLLVLFFLFSSTIRAAIAAEPHKKRPRFEWFMLSNKFFGAVALTMLSYAISLTSATIVNALQGIQYVFLILIVWLFAKRFPRVINENLFGKNLFYLSLAIACILVGLGGLAF